jgi:hypothetical protein
MSAAALVRWPNPRSAHCPARGGGERAHYVHFPLIMLLVNVGLLLLARKMPVALFVSVWLLQILMFLPFFWGSTMVAAARVGCLELYSHDGSRKGGRGLAVINSFR